MPEQLVIRFISSLEVEWLVLSDSNLSQGPQRCPLADVPRLLGKSQTIVLAPTEQLSLYRAKVPPASPARLQKALPYALEDQLIDDIATLHFALGPIEKNADVPVAVVKKAWLDEWVQKFASAQLYVDAIVPDVLGLPYEPGCWTVLLTDETAYVRTGKADGFAINGDMARTLLEISLEEVIDKKPERIKIYSVSDHPALAELQQLQHVTIEILPLITSPFIFLAQHLTLTINLLQGDYRADRALTEVKKLWFIAGGITAAWLVLAFTIAFSQFFYWHHKNNILNKHVTAIYYQTFTNATSIEDPKLRMQREITRLQNNVAGGDFLSLLGIIGNVLHMIPPAEMQLTGMAFNNAALSLQLQINSFATLQKLIQQLQEQGLIVNQDSAMTNTQGVQARITVKREGA